MSDREKLTQALEERDRLDAVLEAIGTPLEVRVGAINELLRRLTLRVEELERDRDPDPTHPTRESTQARPADGGAAS